MDDTAATRAAAIADARATAARAGLTVPERQAYVAALVGSLVLDLDTPEIHAAVAARDVARTTKRAADLAFENESRRAGRFTRKYRLAAEDADTLLDIAIADVERAVRAANPDAPNALIVETARNL